MIDRVGALIDNPLDNGSPPGVTLVPVAGSRRRRTRRDNKTSSKVLDHQGQLQDASGIGKGKRKKKEVVPELVLMLERIRMRMWHLPATQFR